MNFLLDPWPWYIGGPVIALTMFLSYFFGKRFGMSSNLDTLCSVAGASKVSSNFKSDIKPQYWSLVVVLGAVIGGFIAMSFMTSNPEVKISADTLTDLSKLGIVYSTDSLVPESIFGLDAVLSVKGFAILLLGGLLVGFGARYAGGCTSGHSIVGLSSLQLPSLIATIGFFVGGLIMTWFIFPLIF
ncbi:MAG: YeeE/YedE family protein [Flavobacteriaceae bacterium]|nr:YeeE/YedE family protein [Flavobacteriaceae bacterium]